MHTAYEAAVADSWKGLRPQLKNAIIYDDDWVRTDGSRFGPECAGHWVITASTKRKPQVVDISNVNLELAPQDVYSGMYTRIALNFFSFNTNGNTPARCPPLRLRRSSAHGWPMPGRRAWTR